ncbi:O-antigen ligase family protein [Psychroserpens sp.]|uniref:O-antigen ligase family protein n=1 Tax=Psychroserpens sp. TaxID=2020870 RepID=UPI001B23E86F|nr:O-antigen ligase family protein [Psychroserpens sp.]MBO6605393.1 O-antigen ligase family protein [Psychroserpens sp.]MBO6630169.1 O-antigen ligase family protein [Psychroserpens sp.]MBO6653798.1 O-antigen ligase family protein [Psychroserpens sp.]MBO6682119.1 O-antigen ligase family protein [Psychroserpens sp.]MBO6748767.1 O-antigen ligase family protein [Psychroserpens sp.]
MSGANNIIHLNNQDWLDKISLIALILSVFFLPLNMWLNNLLTLLFIGLQLISFVKTDFKEKQKRLKQNRNLLFIFTLPFTLTVIGTIYSDNLSNAYDDIVRLAPILMLPMLFVLNPDMIRINRNAIGWVLVIGCLLSALLCWANNFYTIYNNNESFMRILKPEYANQGLTKVLDLHASYIAILVNTSLAFIVYHLDSSKLKIKRLWLYIGFGILVLFLFHLLARTAIVTFLLAALVYIIARKKWKILIVLLTGLTVLTVTVQSIDQNYLRDRLINSLNFFQKESQFSKKDDRFNRLKASYEVFLQHPIIGPGTADDDDFRRPIFKRNRDVIAYNQNYNAHNQFFEYLSTYGIVGAIVFIVLFYTIFAKVIRHKNYFYLFIFSAFLLASMTESLLERTLGIVYFGLALSFLIILTTKNGLKSQHYENN